MNLLYRFRLPLLWLACAGAAFFLTLQAGSKTPQGTILAEAAPEGTSLAVDGKEFSDEITLPTGEYRVEARKKGFAPQSQIVAIKEGQSVKISFVLDPNTTETENWYAEHPDDQKLAEGISSRQSDYNIEAAAKANPLLQQLPFIFSDGAGGFVRIDYGVPVKKSTQPAIYITAPTPETRRDAITWIRSQGYDPATMDFVFRKEANPWSTNE